MPRFMLFGANTTTLLEAKLAVERATSLQLIERDGYFSGGIHYTFGFPGSSIDVKNNIDFDGDEKIITDCLSEPEFPEYKYLLYLSDVDENLEILQQILARPEAFVKLRDIRV